MATENFVDFSSMMDSTTNCNGVTSTVMAPMGAMVLVGIILIALVILR